LITGVHHFSISVTDLNRTLEFYTKVLELTLQSQKRNSYDGLGRALFGSNWGVDQSFADLEIAVLNCGQMRIEFIEYRDPPARPFHKNPSIAGSAHIAFKVQDIEGTRRRLEEAGVEFHTPIQSFPEKEDLEWKWCYFRDPDGIVLELVEEVRH